MSSCPHCQNRLAPDATTCPACGADVPGPITVPASLLQEVTPLLEQGRKLEAVKVYQEYVGCSLKEAKDAVEAMAVKNGSNATLDLDSTLEAEIVRLLQRGDKIQAVKAYQDDTGASLIEAKRAVETFAGQQGIAVEPRGCGGPTAALALTLMLVIGTTLLAILQASHSVSP